MKNSWSSFQSERIRYSTMTEYRGFLQLLSKAKPGYRKTLLEGAPDKLIILLANCALNILRGQVYITNQQKTRLQQHKSDLRNLANKKVSVKRKKKILQKGGFFPLLLPILGPILGAAAGAIVSKIVK